MLLHTSHTPNRDRKEHTIFDTESGFLYSFSKPSTEIGAYRVALRIESVNGPPNGTLLLFGERASKIFNRLLEEAERL